MYIHLFLRSCGMGSHSKCRGPKTHPKSRNTKTTPRLHKPFRKLRANFSKMPCDASQEPDGTCSEKLVQMNFCILGGFFRVGFPPLKRRSDWILPAIRPCQGMLYTLRNTWEIDPIYPRPRLPTGKKVRALLFCSLLR